MQATITKDAAKATIKLTGRFDFNTHRDFRTAYESLITDAAVKAVTVDFAGVDYLDSSALTGMFRWLGCKAMLSRCSISLISANCFVLPKAIGTLFR